tara:strand:- start:78 stop:695 length:618 start_codon:yes stop_codon:yes gene_type:complete
MNEKDLRDIGKTMFFTFGRFQPPTKGHGNSFDVIKKAASSVGADYRIYLSQSQDKKGENPLPASEKADWVKKMFPVHRDHIYSDPTIRTATQVLQDIESCKVKGASKQTYWHVVMMVGSDRVAAFQWIKKHNYSDYTFTTMEVRSTGDRDPDGDSYKISGTNQRKYAFKNNLKEFRKGIPSVINSVDAEELMKQIRKYLPANYNP